MLLNYLSANPRKLFLIDGLGALLSTLLLLVIAYFEDVFGMPRNVLYSMAALTIVYTAYSLGTYILNPTNWKRFLAPIAIANIIYCLLTLMVLFNYLNELTTLGIAYFLIELFIILFLAVLELQLTSTRQHL